MSNEDKRSERKKGEWDLFIFEGKLLFGLHTIAVAGIPSSGFSSLIFFMATTCSVSFEMALYTIPYVPFLKSKVRSPFFFETKRKRTDLFSCILFKILLYLYIVKPCPNFSCLVYFPFILSFLSSTTLFFFLTSF